jgi:FKBP-type peptidyl-prolyl cis-trans isomerase
MATMEQQKTDENVLKLVEEHKVQFKVKCVLFHVISLEPNIYECCYCVEMQREKQAALEKILKLQQHLDAKQKLELEIQTMKGKLEVMKHMPGEQDSESKKKMDELTEELKEKVAESEEMEALNKALVIKERKSNDELQHARKELIDVSYHIE